MFPLHGGSDLLSVKGIYYPSPLSLCGSSNHMEKRTLRVRRLEKQTSSDNLHEQSPSEQVQTVWPLTRQARVFKEAASPGQGFRAQSRLPRHVFRLRRREG